MSASHQHRRLPRRLVWTFSAAVLTLGIAPGFASATSPSASAAPQVLELAGKISVPRMSGTWDHMTVDPKTDRLFLSAQDQQRVYVVPLKGGAIRCLSGGFDRPQGELYVPSFDRLVVTNGRSGLVRILRGHDYRTAATLKVSLGADMIAFDPRHRLLYVESGGTDSHRGPGWLALINPSTGGLVGRIDIGYRAAALVMARRKPILYVAIPALDQVAVVNTDTRRIVERLSVPGRPASMALDEGNGRLFVATRTFAGDPRPPTFNVLDAATGRLIESLPSKDATEDMYVDAAHGLIYTTSLQGFVQAYRRLDGNHYALADTVPTGPHSGTSQFVPELDELCVAVPPHSGQPGAVWIYRPTGSGI